MCRLFSPGNSPVNFARQLGESPAPPAASAGLAGFQARLSGRGKTFRRAVERSGSVSALRKFSGEERHRIPAVGLTCWVVNQTKNLWWNGRKEAQEAQ